MPQSIPGDSQRSLQGPGSSSCGVIALLVLLLAGPGLAATPQRAREEITAQHLRRHTMFLASDTLEGRAAGTQGGRAAAAYLALEFTRAGLQPAAAGGDFLQPFDRGYQNLLGLVAGSDPELSDEVILVSGHFDHVGLGNRGNSYGPFGQIHNGADDNASGTAAVLAVARAVASLDVKPRRSILFALWDAEENGLLGSKYWLKHPTLDVENVRLMINCDMVGRLRNNVLVAYGTRTASGLRRYLAESNPGSALKFNFDWRQRSDSDHWPFFERGIPYLLLHTGDHEDYHRPSDDPDKVNYEGLAVISQLLFNLTLELANAEQSLTFRESVRQESKWPKQRADVLWPPPPSRLGIAWNNERQAGEPFEVTFVERESPAEIAGLRVGDRITSFAFQPAGQTTDLVEIVLAAPQQTTIIVERAGHPEPLSLPVTLRGEPVRIGVSWKFDDAEPGVAIVTSVRAGSPAARAGIEPLDRLWLPLSGTVGAGTLAKDWLRDLSTSDEPVTLCRGRRGRISEITLQPLPAPDPPTTAAGNANPE